MRITKLRRDSYLNSGVSNVVYKTGEQTISGQKRFSAQILADSGIDLNNEPILIEERTTPSTPPTNHWKIYTKSDGLYILDDTGTETGPLGSGSGGGGISIGDAVSGGTAGSILYIDASGNLAQENANLFYDESLNRIGLNTTTPLLNIGSASGDLASTAQGMHVFGSTDGYLVVEGGSSSRLIFADQGGLANRKLLELNFDGGRLAFNFLNDDLTNKYTNVLVVDSLSGRVGIGTTSLSSILNIGGDRIVRFQGASGVIQNTAGYIKIDASSQLYLDYSELRLNGFDPNPGSMGIPNTNTSSGGPGSACLNLHQITGTPKSNIMLKFESADYGNYFDILGDKVIRVADNDAGIVDIIRLYHELSSVTSTVGTGIGIAFETENTSGVQTKIAGITAEFATSASGASFDTVVKILAVDYNGTREGLRVQSNGSAALLGFYGVAAVARHAGFTQTYSTTSSIHAARTAAALTDSTGGTANTTCVAISGSGDDANINDNFADIIAQINNLRTDQQNTAQVLNELIDALQNIGITQ